MPMTTPALALAALLQLTQEEAPPPEPPAPAAAEAPAPTDSAPTQAQPETAPEKRELSRITLKDGQELRGVVVRQDERVVVVELGQGEQLELPARLVKSVKAEPNARVRDNGEVWFQDPNRTRYLYAPSAMMLRGGEGYFSQKELLFTSVNYGLTDFLTLQAGAVLPFWLVDGGFNFIGGLKVGGEVAPRVHLAAGAQALFLPSNLLGGASGGVSAAGVVFGTATYGTPDAHLSLGVGTPFIFDDPGSQVFPGTLLLTASGNLRLTQRLSLVSENWVVPSLADSLSDGTLPMVNSLAARIFGEKWAVDVGLIRVPQVPIPIPWLDFTYNFG
jgi:hypothetical protein